VLPVIEVEKERQTAQQGLARWQLQFEVGSSHKGGKMPPELFVDAGSELLGCGHEHPFVDLQEDWRDLCGGLLLVCDDQHQYYIYLELIQVTTLIEVNLLMPIFFRLAFPLMKQRHYILSL
jgi:hypothetical protein